VRLLVLIRSGIVVCLVVLSGEGMLGLRNRVRVLAGGLLAMVLIIIVAATQWSVMFPLGIDGELLPQMVMSYPVILVMVSVLIGVEVLSLTGIHFWRQDSSYLMVYVFIASWVWSGVAASFMNVLPMVVKPVVVMLLSGHLVVGMVFCMWLLLEIKSEFVTIKRSRNRNIDYVTYY
jgi:hypothetical protein